MLDTIGHHGVVELRLARPPVNALDEPLLRALTEALGDPEAEAFVLSGRAGMFSAGLDVPTLLRLDEAGVTGVFDALFALLRTLTHSPVPVVAAITGHCPAGGAVIALFCDCRIMARGDYRIGLNEVAVGLPVPPLIYAAMLRLTGERVAERLCVDASMLTPDEAVRVGLVDELAGDGEVVTAALRRCDRWSELPRRALRDTRDTARAGLRAAVDDHAVAASILVRRWFEAETQQAMRALVARTRRTT